MREVLKFRIYAKRSDAFVIANKNHDKKYNDCYLMHVVLLMKKPSIPVVNNIHHFVSKSNG